MQAIQLMIASLLAQLFYALTPTPPKTVEVTKTVLDPRGMVPKDVEFIKSKSPQLQWKKGMTLEEIANVQGWWQCIKFIESHVVGRRTN